MTDGTVPERDALFRDLVELHDAGDVDLFEVMMGPDVSWAWSPDFAARQQLYKGVIPRLSVSAARIMAALETVTDGMWCYVLDEAFLDWCSARSGRVDEVLALFDEGHPVADRFVLAAFVAGLRKDVAKYTTPLVEIVTGVRPGSRHLGTRALAVMPTTDGASIHFALAALKSVVEGTELEAELRAGALSALFEIAARAPEMAVTCVLGLLDLAANNENAALLDACADALARHGQALPAAILEGLVEPLSHLDASRTHVLGAVGIGLYRLLSAAGHEERAFALLERLLVRDDGDAILEKLGSVSHELSNGDVVRLGQIAARWLLSGEIGLCSSVANLVRGANDRELSFDVDFSSMSLTDRQMLFLSRKVVGWLLLQPVAAASLVVSLLRHATEATAEALGEILLDPVLMNYPGSARRYLDLVAPTLSGVAAATITRTLARHDEYLRAIEAVGLVPELHPSERQRRIAYQRESDLMSSARREAEEKSVLSSIVHRFLLLHGVRCISYVRDFGGGTRRLDNKLGTISTEIERAMQWTFDPLGLESTLLGYRLEPLLE